MAKSNISFKKTKGILDDILTSITSKSEMEKLAEYNIDIIMGRTRGFGLGVKKHLGNRTKLKKVSPKYADWRQKQKNTHPEMASGNKCNLTFTGDMLDNMKVKLVTKGAYYLGWNNKEDEKKALYVTDQGRAFLYLARAEVKLLRDHYNDQLGDTIKKV